MSCRCDTSDTVFQYLFYLNVSILFFNSTVSVFFFFLFASIFRLRQYNFKDRRPKLNWSLNTGRIKTRRTTFFYFFFFLLYCVVKTRLSFYCTFLFLIYALVLDILLCMRTLRKPKARNATCSRYEYQFETKPVVAPLSVFIVRQGTYLPPIARYA